MLLPLSLLSALLHCESERGRVRRRRLFGTWSLEVLLLDGDTDDERRLVVAPYLYYNTDNESRYGVTVNITGINIGDTATIASSNVPRQQERERNRDIVFYDSTYNDDLARTDLN